jgi:hypothetical protein
MFLLKCEQRAQQSLEVHLPSSGRSYNYRPKLALERRGRLRSFYPLCARVWGVDINDEVFSVDCKVENISSSGAYLTLPREMAFSSDISLAVHLESADGDLTAAIKGTVIRVEQRSGHKHGIAVKTINYSFL